jgi:LacI family transcriptional regulator
LYEIVLIVFGVFLMPEKITIYDIAKEAQVSIATVSRVLTGSAPVSKATEERVKVVLEKYNFQPSIAARTLMNSRSMIIGVILPDITNPFYSTIFTAIQKMALQFGYSLLLYNAMNNLEIESKGLNYLQQHKVDGLIFMGGRVNELELDKKYVQELKDFSADIPMVIVNGEVPELACTRVYADEANGIRKLVSYLVELGHREIALLGGIRSMTVSRNRELAFRESLTEYGLQLREDWIIPTGFSIQDGMDAIEKLNLVDDKPSAIIGINDLVALGIIKYCRIHDITIPADFSLVGFDDSYITEVTFPELTTMSQNYDVLAATAIETVMKCIEETQSQKDVAVEMNLITRNSCQSRNNH